MKKENVFPLYLEEVERWSSLPVAQWEAMQREERCAYIRFEEGGKLTVGVGKSWSKAVTDESYVAHWPEFDSPNLLTDAELIERLEKEGVFY